MWQDVLSYWDSLWRDIPIWVYEVGILVLLAGLVICLLTCGIRKGLRYGLGLLLIEYVLLVYCSTVFFRNTGKLQYDFTPLWSYFSYFRGEDDRLLAENIMNVVVFMPVGLLLSFTIKKTSYVRVAIIGACISIGIELLQLIFKKGFSELDDVMHNTLGCMLGYSLFRMISWCVNK